MDNPVIVLDSSDDEVSDSGQKKISKKTFKRVNPLNRCVIGQRVLVSNKQITITESHIKSNPNRTVLINNASSTITTRMPSNHNNNKELLKIKSRKLDGIHHTDGKNFRRKIDTGEITIMPIGSTTAPSPKSIKISTITKSKIFFKQQSQQQQQQQQQQSPPAIPNREPSNPIKRIAPIKISDVVTIRASSMDKSNSSDSFSKDSFATIEDEEKAVRANGDSSSSMEPVTKRIKVAEKTPLNDAFTTLLDACRAADSSTDMDKLINKKLLRYYQTVHPDFVNSKSFCKNVLVVADDIKAQPSLVYLKISGILEELNIRRKSGETVVANEEIASTGDARKDYQIRRLNKALYVLKKKIAKLDEAEVDWDDEDNSIFMISERYKKRAWEIYEKICDITGESKNAQRLVKKPIKYNGTSYKEFNRTIQTFVNETRTFPDMFDVLRCLEHCNLQYSYRLNKEECKRIAQDAFLQIGTTLQKRRKTDLYEMVSYFTGSDKDPALEDTDLQTKLNENQKYHNRIKELIDKFTQQQQDPAADATAQNRSSDKIATCTNQKNTIDIDHFNKINDKIDALNESIELIDDDGYSFLKDFESIDGIPNTSTENEIEAKASANNKEDAGPSIVSVTSLHHTEIESTFEENNITISDDDDL